MRHYGYAGPGKVLHPVYLQKIKEWQTRIQREGWLENEVHSILVEFRSLARYRIEIVDHWDTLKEFMEAGFSGDCMNIVVFLMATLRSVGYSNQMRLLVAKSLFEDHALLHLELPDGRWRVYDVVPRSVPRVEMDALKPVVKFDEKRIVWFPPEKGAPPYASQFPHPLAAARSGVCHQGHTETEP